MWRENVAFDYKFTILRRTENSLKPVVIQIVHNFPPKTAIYSSRYLQSMKRHLQAAILKGSFGTEYASETSSLDFPFSWHVFFFISFNNNTISFLFSCPSCDFHQNNGKKKETDIF